MPHDIKFIKDTLYDLCKRHSDPIKLVKIVSQTQSNYTGQRVVNKKSVSIRRALHLPREMTRKFIQDIGYLAANKNFTQGAVNDFATELFAIDTKKLPKSFDPNLNDYLVCLNKRYDLATTTSCAGYYMFLAKETVLVAGGGSYDPGEDFTEPTTDAQEIFTFNFAFGDASRTVYTAPKAFRIIRTILDYDVAFNSQNATVTVGLNNVVDQLMTSSDNNPFEQFEFSLTNDQQVNEGDQITLTVTPNGSTIGTGKLTFIVSYE